MIRGVFFVAKQGNFTTISRIMNTFQQPSQVLLYGSLLFVGFFLSYSQQIKFRTKQNHMFVLSFGKADFKETFFELQMVGLELSASPACSQWLYW